MSSGCWAAVEVILQGEAIEAQRLHALSLRLRSAPNFSKTEIGPSTDLCKIKAAPVLMTVQAKGPVTLIQLCHILAVGVLHDCTLLQSFQQAHTIWKVFPAGYLNYHSSSTYRIYLAFSVHSPPCCTVGRLLVKKKANMAFNIVYLVKVHFSKGIACCKGGLIA